MVVCIGLKELWQGLNHSFTPFVSYSGPPEFQAYSSSFVSNSQINQLPIISFKARLLGPESVALETTVSRGTTNYVINTFSMHTRFHE